MITTLGGQFQDWTADYDLYSQQRVNPSAIFQHIRRQIDQRSAQTQQPLAVMLDDTLVRKTGLCIPGASYRRDPLGPKFQVHLVWAQRFLAMTAAVPGPEGAVRAIPIGFKQASTPRKPRKTASHEVVETYKEAMKQANLSRRASEMLHELQQQRQEEQSSPEAVPPKLVVLGDGSFSNRNVLKNLPGNTTYIGRFRKDARLYWLPEAQKAKGRRRVYGERAPTPEEVHRDKSIEWQTVKAFTGGKLRELRVKVMRPVRWKTAGGGHTLQVVVVAPLPRKGPKGRRAYSQPSYLVCTDPDLPVEEMVRQYIWRWDIEVTHRDEKTILGVGEAQVTNPNSASLIPASAVAAYSMLHWAAMEAFGWDGKPEVLPPPKWRDPDRKHRASTLDLINELRRELWASAIRPSHLSRFVHSMDGTRSSQNGEPDLLSGILYSTA